MFRPAPEQNLLRFLPIRAVFSLLPVVALVLSVVFILTVEHEKNLALDLALEMARGSRTIGEDVFLRLGTRGEAIKISILLLLLTIAGVAVVATYQSYRSARERLEEVKSLARNILESIPTGVVTLDHSGRLLSVNRAAGEILNLPLAAGVGKPFEDLLSGQEPLGRTLREVLRMGSGSNDRDLAFSGEDGKRRTLRLSTSPLKGPDAKRAGRVLLIKDITEFVEMEQQVRRTEKLAAINTLSAGVAHEIRNPLGAMDLNLRLLEEELQGPAPSLPALQEYLEVLHVEIKRLKGILDDFTRFAHPQKPVLGTVHVAPIVGHLVALVEEEAKEKGVEIESRIPEGLPPILGDGRQLTQALLNVVINALEAMPSGGTLGLSARRAGSALELRFSDSGRGIRPGDVEKIFEPFYTTKPYGTGMGLAIVHRIIEDHQGKIRVDSVFGSGTTLTVTLPIEEASTDSG